MLPAQEGPQVPCTDCDARIHSPYPASGPWANTNQTGSGFLFEIQNGVLGGFYFGYDNEGDPQWMLFSGPLVEDEDPGILWSLDTNVSLYDGGSCIGCPYQAPTDISPAGTIRIEFLQKNHGTFQFDGNEKQFMVPLLFGSGGTAHFQEETPYLFPELGGEGEDASAWVLVRTDHSGDAPVRTSSLVHFRKGKPPNVKPALGRLWFFTEESAFSLGDPNPPFASIFCGPDSLESRLRCDLTVNVEDAPPDTYNQYTMPIANLGANRFFAEDELGITIEGFRLGYD